MIPEKSPREERAIILDYLEHGYPFDNSPMKSAIAQALGTTHLTLLELIPKKEVFLQPYEEVYIGEGKRDKIHHIKGRIPMEKLTATSVSELKHAIEEVVKQQPERFLKFFNEARPLTMRMHQLELLPGLGKKHMWEVIQARKAKPFESFEDLKERVKLLPDPRTIIIKRVLLELEGKDKHKLFVS
jgi:putative nucleotide binding protein